MQLAFVTPSPPLQSRNAVVRSTSDPRVPRRQRSHPAMTVHRVRNARDFAAALPLPESTPLVVFSFITAGCRACKYASHAYDRLSNDFGARVRFFEMDVSERDNQLLGKRLGVEAVPAFQFYAFKKSPQHSGVGVLEEFVGPRTVPRVRERLAHYLDDGLNMDEYDFETD